MCGRYALTCEADELVEAFDVPPPGFEHVPRYNVAPGQDAPILAEDRRGRRLGLMRWRLVPAWAPEATDGHVNARAESVAGKPSFEASFRRRRCLVPASGFYEWRRDGARRVPFWFQPREGGLLTLAAIWDRWSRPGVEPRFGFAVLTADANHDVRPTHHRMPVLVPPEARSLWLDRATALGDLTPLLRPAPAGTLLSHEVSTRVNRAAEDDPGLLEPLT